MKNTMFRKVAIVIALFFFSLFLDNCKANKDVNTEEPEPNYEYRYNIEVIYTRSVVDEPEGEDKVSLRVILYDPLADHPLKEDFYYIEMTKIGENKFRCYLPKVWVQASGAPKHEVMISADWRRYGHQWSDIPEEDIEIQGAIDREIYIADFGGFINSFLKFRMSKE